MPIAPILMTPAYRWGAATPWGGEALRSMFRKDIPVSLKTRQPIPKRLIDDCMRAVMERPFTPPIAAGDVLIPNVCGTGVDVIATKAVP